ncbi:uncharacterized protein LOC117117998 [Anneissia japonica]|uniref:uncharacterized protein LOC117117998 n=1 Tax=Anneissia japonica TaxID=1529436 RepID=UPI00142598A5|nr:uncharacterized protein LOC117117998 [Anneissia japonica]
MFRSICRGPVQRSFRYSLLSRLDSTNLASITQLHVCTANNRGSEFPDLNTSVDVHKHKLERPKPTPKITKDELKTLEKDTKGSLIPETLKQMENDADFQMNMENLKKLGQKKLTKEERIKRQRALNDLGIPSFRDFVKSASTDSNGDLYSLLRKTPIEIFQLNIGLYCNQACSHCHVESSPKRKEMMNRQTAEKCLEVLSNSPSIHTVDITGGAPELCSEFRFLAKRSKELGLNVIDRCNLTALLEPGQEDTAQFLADNEIIVIASLPCYSAKNVNIQRGAGVFNKSIQSLLLLNSLGYGKPSSPLQLHLVYNPLGAFLAPSQADLEVKYKEELWDNFGIEFNNLFTITNMPVKRFADFLYRRNELKDYMHLLVRNFNGNSMEGLMCRNYININWDGKLFDCDFNQQLDMPMRKVKSQGNASPNEHTGNRGPSIWDINSTSEVEDLRIVTDSHCFGCTAGLGSSCQGTTV